MVRFRFALLLALLPFPAFAGAWTPPKGDGIWLTQLTYFESAEYFDANGERQSQDRFRKWEIQPYGEYGVSDRLAVGGKLYLQQVNQSGSGNGGIGDPEIFLRYKLWQQGSHTLSVEPLMKLPSLFVRDELPRGGSRSTDVELALLYGANLNLLTHHDYADLRIAYRERSYRLKAQYRLDAALGLHVSERIQLIPAVRAIQAAGGDDGIFSENGEQDYDLLKAELGALYSLDEQRFITATVFEHIEGKMTGTGTGIALGIGSRF